MKTLQIDQVLRKHIPEEQFDVSIRTLMQEDLVWRALNNGEFLESIDEQWTQSAAAINTAVLALFSVTPNIVSIGYPDASLPATSLEEAMLAYENYRIQSAPVTALRDAGLLAIALYEKYRQSADWGRILFEISEGTEHRNENSLFDMWHSPFAVLANLLEDPRGFYQALFDSKARRHADTLFRHMVLTQAQPVDVQANTIISTLFSQPVSLQAAVLQSFHQNNDDELLQKASKGLFSRHLVRDLDGKSVRELWKNPEEYLGEGNSFRDLAIIAQFAGEYETAEKLLKANERILQTQLAGNMIQSAALKLEHNLPIDDELSAIPAEALSDAEIATEVSHLGSSTISLKGIEKNIPAFELNEAVEMFQAGNISLGRESAAKTVSEWLTGRTSSIVEIPLRALTWQPGKVIDQLMTMELWTDAAALLRELLAKYPVNRGYLKQAAIVARKLGDPAEELTHLEKLNLLEPGNEEYLRSLASANLSDENWQAAFNYYQRLVNSSAATLVDHLGLAKAALKSGEYGIAQESAQEVLTAEPENSQALAISGYAWHKQGNIDKAIALLDRAIEANGEDCEPWLLRADLYAENGEIIKSVNTLRSALTAHPESDAIRTRLSRTLVENGQAAEALSVIGEGEGTAAGKEQAILKLRAMKQLNLPELALTAEQLYQSFPNDAEIKKEYAIAQLKKGNRAQVTKLLDPATLSGDEELTLVWCDAVLGENYRQLHAKKYKASNDGEKAERLLHDVLMKNPQSVYARMLLAETMIHQGKTEKAFEFLTNLMGDPDAQSSTLLERIQAGFAWAASLFGNTDMALGAAQSVAEANPSWAGVSQTLAEIQANAGEVADAVDQAVDVLEVASDFGDSVEWFGDFMDGLGQSEEAEKKLAEVCSKQTDKTPFLLKLAEYKLARMEKESAKELVDDVKQSLSKLKSDKQLVKAAKVFNELGDIVTVEDCLKQRLTNPESNPQAALTDLAGYLYMRGKYAQSLETLQQAKSRFGAQRWLDLLEADTLHSNGNTDAALEMLQELDAANESLPEMDELAFVPAQWVPLLQPQASTDSLIRSLAFESGNYKEALTIGDAQSTDAIDASVAIEAGYALGDDRPLQPWMGMGTEDERIFASATLSAQVAEALLDTGLIDQAAQVIKRALEVYPQDRVLLAIAGRYSAIIGDAGTAEALFEQILPQYSHSEKYATVVTICALRSLVKAAAEMNRWIEALSWSRVLLQTNVRNLAALRLGLQMQVRGLEFGLFTEGLGITRHFDHAPESMENLRKDLTTLVSQLEAQSNRGFEHWLARAKSALQPNVSNVRGLAVKTPDAEDVAAMMLALHRASQTNTAAQITNKFDGDAKVAYAWAYCLKDTNPEGALESLKKARKNATCLPWSNALAQALYRKLNENYSAINEIEEAVQSWPAEPEWHVLAAECWQCTGDNQNAINHLEQAEKLLPEDGRMKYLLGKALLESKDADKAIQVLEPAAKNAANHYETWETLAEAYYSAGKKELALQAAEKAGSINGFSVRPALLSARINLDNGDVKKALELAQVANSHDEQDAESLILLAKAWQANGSKLQAMQALEKVSHARNTSVQVYIDQAKLVQEINGSASAKVMLEALEQKYPENIEVLNLLAEAQVAAGDKTAAQATAQRSLKLSELQPGMQRFAGKMDLDAGHLDQAINHFSQAIAQEPQDAESYIDLGEAYIQQRDFESALKMLDQASELAPADVRPLMSAANLLRNGKDYPRAESKLRKAAEIAPNDLNIRRQLGAVIALNMVHSSQEASSHI